MNEWRGKGTLVRDPELIETQGGSHVWAVTLAINGSRFDPDEGDHVVSTLFVRVQLYGWAAEWAGRKKFSKGEELYVQGELDQHTYTKKGGEQETKTRVTGWFVVPTRRKNEQHPEPPAVPKGSSAHDPFA